MTKKRVKRKKERVNRRVSGARRRAEALTDPVRSGMRATYYRTKSMVSYLAGVDRLLPEGVADLIGESFETASEAAGRHGRKAQVASGVTLIIIGILTSWTVFGVFLIVLGVVAVLIGLTRNIRTADKTYREALRETGLNRDFNIPFWSRD